MPEQEEGEDGISAAGEGGSGQGGPRPFPLEACVLVERETASRACGINACSLASAQAATTPLFLSPTSIQCPLPELRRPRGSLIAGRPESI